MIYESLDGKIYKDKYEPIEYDLSIQSINIK